MAKQMLIYEQPVPVSARVHRNASVEMGLDFSFAADLNSVPITGAEFSAAAGSHVILFAGEGEDTLPILLLGPQTGLNVFVGADGGWTTDYVPAFLRRYPFVFTRTLDDTKLSLSIDSAFAGFNYDGRGERLFEEDGNRTDFLSERLKFAEAFQKQFERTRQMTRRLVELDLLTATEATFENVSSGQTAQMGGFKTVNRDRLRRLDEKAVVELNRTDALELCHLHLHSLSNLPRMARHIEAAHARRHG